MNPIIVLTHKDHQDFRCPRGYCHEGSSYAIFKIGIFLDKADFEHSLAITKNQRIDKLTHRVLSMFHKQG